MKHIAVHHAPCQDGLGAAWSFEKYMTENSKEFEIIPAIHQNSNDITDKLNKKTTLYTLDFAYKYETMLEYAKKCKKIIVVDHHISNAESYARELPTNVEFNFCNDNSGAVLTWKYFYPKNKVPLFLQYIEDYDIWANKLTGTHEFFAWYTARNPKNTHEFNNLVVDFPETIEDFLESRIFRHGQTVIQFRQTLIESIIESPVHTTLCGVEVVKFNSPFLQLNTYIGNQAVAKYGKPSWIWYLKGDVQCNSLRSVDELADVSKIAASLNGGGHRNAAGFTGTGHE